MGRAADLEWFGFGQPREVPTRTGGMKTVRDRALHVQCAWRLVGPDGIVTGLGDLHVPAGDPDVRPEGWSPFDSGGQARLDERTLRLRSEWAAAPPVVEVVSVDAFGGLRLQLTHGYGLEVWPDDSLPDEYWRLFQPARGAPHFVVTGAGIHQVPEQDMPSR
jgi:hypothetical protein